MARPPCCRRIHGQPARTTFGPSRSCVRQAGEQVELTLDEFEAIRLADGEGLYQEEAAALMDVSRPTFSRILERARHKVALVLVEGRWLQIGGGQVEEVNKADNCGCPLRKKKKSTGEKS